VTASTMAMKGDSKHQTSHKTFESHEMCPNFFEWPVHEMERPAKVREYQFLRQLDAARTRLKAQATVLERNAWGGGGGALWRKIASWKSDPDRHTLSWKQISLRNGLLATTLMAGCFTLLPVNWQINVHTVKTLLLVWPERTSWSWGFD
jgi:hypothetical protein